MNLKCFPWISARLLLHTLISMIGESIHSSMHPISRIVNNLLSQVTSFSDNNVPPFSITSHKRKLSFSTTDIKSKKSKVDVNSDDFIVALPPEIRELILQKLDIADYHRFGAVCKTWRLISVTAKQNQHFSLQQLPWLMLSSNSSFQDAHHGFFSLRHGKIFKLKLREVHGCRCCGSSWGWLIMANESGDNFLLNPFSRIQIQLPSQTALVNAPDHILPHIPAVRKWMNSRSYIRKAMLLTPPVIRCIDSSSSNYVNCADGNCIVVAIYACRSLCFCRLGDKAWTNVGNRHLQMYFVDIIFYNGQLYAVTKEHDLVLVELGTHPKITRMNLSCTESHDPSLSSHGRFIYLVESCGGELLMVVRIWYGDFRSLPPRRTTMFKVFKLDSSGRCWVKVDSLGDQMLFVGTSSGISISASHFSGFRGNCIYFTSPKAWCDLGIFSLDDGSVKSFFPTDSHSHISPPIWFMPNQL